MSGSWILNFRHFDLLCMSWIVCIQNSKPLHWVVRNEGRGNGGVLILAMYIYISIIKYILHENKQYNNLSCVKFAMFSIYFWEAKTVFLICPVK